jgi:PKD repeat protein
MNLTNYPRTPYFWLIALFFVAINSQSQTANIGCASDQRFQMSIESMENGEELQHQKDIFISEKCEQLKADRQNRGGENPVLNLDYFIIPVVFHIVYDPGNPLTNIPYERIVSQMNVMNELMNNGLPNQQNCSIQFCLAQNTGSTTLLWQNTAEKGVMRYANATAANHYMSIEAENNLMELTSAPDVFSFDRYLNIWVVADIGSDAGNGVVGYSPLPILSNSSSASELDGIVLRFDAVGRASDDTNNEWPFSPNLNLGKVMVHELGHYFSLYHVFHQGCSGLNASNSVSDDCDAHGDYVCDTPAQYGPETAQSIDCGSIFTLPNTCVENYDWSGYLNEQTHNHILSANAEETDAFDFIGSHMNYSLDACRQTFSAGQVLRMHAHLTTYRTVLSHPDNLVQTGLAGGACIPEVLSATILVNDGAIAQGCANNEIQLSAPHGEGYAATTWEWDFGDGTFGSGYSIAHIYSQPGSYFVQLMVTDANDNTLINTTSIYISNCELDNVSQAHWVFGEHAAVDFSSGLVQASDIAWTSPATGTTTMMSQEGCITMNDPVTGAILFYSNGHHVWDSQGNNLNSNSSLLYYDNPSLWPTCDQTSNVSQISSSSLRISCIPWPENPDHFFIVVPSEYESDNVGGNYTPLNVIHVDLSIGPFGYAELWGKTTNETVLPNGNPNHLRTELEFISLDESFVIVEHCNGEDYWLVGHTNTNNQDGHICVFLISEGGFSDADMAHTSWQNNLKETEANVYFQGETDPIQFLPFNISHDGSLILSRAGAVAAFDVASGTFEPSPALDVQVTNGCFSPSDQYIYGFDPQSPGLGGVQRINYADGEPFSADYIPSYNPSVLYTALQVGPESNGSERIYLSPYYYPSLDAIDNIEASDINQVSISWAVDFTPIGTCVRAMQQFPYFVEMLPDSHLEVIAESNTCSNYSFSIASCYHAYEILWNFGDGNIAEGGLSATHEYSASGVFTVSVTVSRGGGQFPETTQLELVLTQPAQPIISVIPNAVCIGELQELSVIPNDGIGEYYWTISGGGLFGNGTTTTSGEYNTIVWDQPGTWTVTLTAISENESCPNASVSETITVSELPIVTTNAECLNAEVNISGGTEPYDITWYDEQGIAVGTGESIELPASDNYSVTVVDANGCENEAFLAVAYDYANGWTYAGEDWSGQTITFGGDLIIPLGDWPVFNEVNFLFAQGKRLIIQEGAIAFFEDCNFSTCDNNWKGIWVQSFGNGVGTGPGNFFMNGGSIKYAEIGIMNPDIYVWDGPYESGNVHCTNVLFENNRTAVKAEKVGQADDDNFVGPFAYYECEFVVNDEYNQHFTQPFQQHAYLHLVKGNGFKSCSFKNEMSVSEWAERGRAIYAVDARFDVDDIDEDGNEAGLSTFEGFDIAIYNHIFDGQYNGMIIRESSFNKNRIGILSRGVCFHDIVRNSIIVGDNTGLASLDNEVIDREGIVIDGGGFFLLSENDIIGNALSTPDAATNGIRIRDIVTGSEEVYNNSISNCMYANLANGTNSVESEGLRYVCNQHSGSLTDILVSDSPENANAATISPWQSDLGNLGFGETDKAAGNSFTPKPGEWHIDNEGLQIINYLYGSGANEEPTQINGLVNAPIPGAPNPCDLIVVEMLPEIGDVNQNNITNLYSLVAISKTDWLNSKYLYLALLDNGNTQELIEEVEFNWNADVWAMRSKLLTASPYVSASVLYELASQTTKGFPQAVALEVFLANPNVSMDKRFIFYLQETCDFPSYMIEILGLLNNQSALRAALEENLAKNHMRFLDITAELIRIELRNESTTISQLINLLDQMESLTAEFVIIDLLLAQKNKAAAMNRYQNIFTKIRVVPEMKNELKAFSLWMDLVTSVNDWASLSTNDKSRLDLLAVDYYNTTAGKKAMGVLNTFFHEDHFIPPYYSGASGNVRSLIQKSASNLSVHFMSAYPNPASSLLEVKILQGEKDMSNESLIITDNQGKSMASFSIQHGNQQFAIDIRTWAAGVYHIHLQMQNRILETITIEVIH